MDTRRSRICFKIGGEEGLGIQNQKWPNVAKWYNGDSLYHSLYSYRYLTIFILKNPNKVCHLSVNP